jgi:hypothetical protein
MAAKLLETALPVGCSWCEQQLHAFLGVRTAAQEPPVSLVLCPTCDAPTLNLVREHVIGFGRLEEHDDMLVWVVDRGAHLNGTASSSQISHNPLVRRSRGFMSRDGKKKRG